MSRADDIRKQIEALTREYYHEVHEPSQCASFKDGDRIRYSGRVFDDDEMVNLIDSSLEFWLTPGHWVDEFETGLSGFIGTKYCALTNSGSSANLLAFACLTAPELGDRRIMKGDEVITVSAAFPTTVNPIIQYGAIPVFVDVDIPTYNINISAMKSALSERTKAVFVAHTLGNPFNIREVRAFCQENSLWLIEDNCDALGSEYDDGSGMKKTGTFGDLSTYSFYPPHHITLGEGGAVCTNDSLLNRLVRSYRDWGRDCWCPSGKDNTCGKRFSQQSGELPFGYDHKYVYSHFGYNLNVTDMQAAVGCAQLKKLPGFVETRRKNWQYLKDQLSALSGMFILPEAEEHSFPSWFGFLMTLTPEAKQKGFDRAGLAQFLEDSNIQTRNLFSGNYLKHPVFDEMRQNNFGFRVAGSLENTDNIMEDALWIGVYPGMTDGMLDFMVKKIGEYFGV